MPAENTERNRMIVDLPAEVQMAIKLRAVKGDMTTGAVVSEAVKQVFGRDIDEAKAALADQHRSGTGKKKPG
jgi:hypothetical protein